LYVPVDRTAVGRSAGRPARPARGHVRRRAAL